MKRTLTTALVAAIVAIASVGCSKAEPVDAVTTVEEEPPLSEEDLLPKEDPGPPESEGEEIEETELEPAGAGAE